MERKMIHLSKMESKFSILKLKPNAEIPAWALIGDSFFSITKTDDELSIVCEESCVPPNVKDNVEKDWRCFKVEGPLDFSMTGVLSQIAGPLADAKIPIFVVSTFDTDYILVKAEYFEHSCAVLDSQNSITVK